MKKYNLLILMFLFCNVSLGMETVVTSDGRSILLKDDGSYEFIASDPDIDKILIVDSHYFIHHVSEYNQKSIRFMPRFKNIGAKVVTAVKFNATFIDPFGDTVHVVKGGSSESIIKPGKVSGNRLFYKWEDNQFIGGEPYDKLLTAVTNGTGTIKTDIKIIVLKSGEVIKY
jgi:hypothetical protein